MGKNEEFIKKWTKKRKLGKKNYIYKSTAVGTLILLILLIMKDFAVHPITFSISELGNLVFKNIFISIILSGFASIQAWEWQERKYKKLRGEK
jgi:hypothetical protein